MISIVSYGQIIEYDTYDGPLASGKTTSMFLMFAIGFGVLGIVLLKLSNDKEKIMSKPFSYLGILAFFLCYFMPSSFICLD